MITKISLSKTTIEDLDALFQFQLDEEANYLAAFTSKDSSDKDADIEKYSKFLTDPTKNTQTIKANDAIVGSIAKFEIDGDAEITYWIDKNFWGKGVATAALKQLLDARKQHDRSSDVSRIDNIGSQTGPGKYAGS